MHLVAAWRVLAASADFGELRGLGVMWRVGSDSCVRIVPRPLDCEFLPPIPICSLSVLTRAYFAKEEALRA